MSGGLSTRELLRQMSATVTALRENNERMYHSLTTAASPVLHEPPPSYTASCTDLTISPQTNIRRSTSTLPSAPSVRPNGTQRGTSLEKLELYLIELIAYTFELHRTDVMGIAIALDRTSRPISTYGPVTLLSPEDSSALLDLSMRLKILRKWLIEDTWATMYRPANGGTIRDTIIQPLKQLGFPQHRIAYVMDMICAYEEHYCLPTRRKYTLLGRYAPKSWLYALFHGTRKHSNDNFWKTVFAHRELVRAFPFDPRVAKILKHALSNLAFGDKGMGPSSTEGVKVRMRSWSWDGRGPMRKEFLEMLQRVEGE